MSYYTYKQNNSGGRFVRNSDVAEVVIVEARSPSEADERALDIGIYFDGCADDRDCSCCGDRWYAQSGYGCEETEEPSIYGNTDLQSYVDSNDNWFEKCIYVYHLDGTKDVYQAEK